MDNRTFGIILLVFTTFFWGSTFILVKITTSIVPLDGFITIRFFIASLIIAIIAILDAEARQSLLNRDLLKAGSILGTFLYLSFFFQTEGLQLTTPAKAAFITGFGVVLVPIFARFMGTSIIKREQISVVLAFIGLAFLSLDFSQISIINRGDLLILITAICIALHILFTDKYDKLNIRALVLVQLLVISLESFIISLFRKSIWIPDTSTSGIIWLTLAVTAILASAFAFLSQTYAQQEGVPPHVIAIIFSLEPVFALVIDIILKLYPTVQGLIGMFLIFLAMLLVSFIQREN
ncbi:MAG: DMT family transporter [Candidatus Heimdallarchaeota archaeon]|nr:DMT family transporter [Candidatus Heimdallarchaeota archaeon]